jgi:outer membrane protein assembly factor BamC
LHAAVLALAALTLGGCSSDGVTGDGKVDYRSQAAKIAPLDVPPDLTQLQPTGGEPAKGTVSASSFTPQNQQTASGPTASADAVAPRQVGDARIVRDGDVRRIVTSESAEQVWPQIEAFWKAQGFNLAVDEPKSGLLQTDWAENRAKLSHDFIRETLGKVLDSLYDTGFRDRFRTRVERTDQGTEITVTHQGMEEVLTGAQKDQAVWQSRPSDPGLEAVMLQRLLVAIGGKDAAVAQATAASAPAAASSAAAPSLPAAPEHAHLLSGQPAAALQLDENFEHAWRHVGLALDRGGFTVEDRDRAKGLYFVRYVDPKLAGQEEPNFFQKLFGHKEVDPLSRYRIEVKGTDQAPTTTVSVLDNHGAPDHGEPAQRIIKLLYEDLK